MFLSLFFTCCICMVLFSWSQDKTTDPRSEEMGTAPSNQWRQQRDFKQLHTGADGVALPAESVQSHAGRPNIFFYFFDWFDCGSHMLGVDFFTALKEPVLPSLQKDYPVSVSIVVVFLLNLVSYCGKTRLHQFNLQDTLFSFKSLSFCPLH